MKNKQTVLGIILFLLPLFVFVLLKYTGLIDNFIVWSQNNVLLFVIVLLLLKIIGIVYPPMPGGILTLGAIPIVGWKFAYLIDFLGNTIGATIAYYLGKEYGFIILNKLFDENIVQKFRKIKIKKDKELETIIVIRILGANVVEIISYGAGLLKIDFPKFLFATIVSHMAVGIPIYYFANNIFSTSNIFTTVIFSALGFFVIWKLKGRYFE